MRAWGKPYVIYYHFRAFNSKNKEVMTSYDRRAPMSADLNSQELIQCLSETIPWIPFGRKARVECASEMCYAYDGVPGKVLPNEPLKFEVEVLTKDKQYLPYEYEHDLL